MFNLKKSLLVPKKGRYAGAYFNEDFYIIATYSGFGIGTRQDYKGENLILPAQSSDTALGEALNQALSKTRYVLPEPNKDYNLPPEVEFDYALYDPKKADERYQQWVADLLRRIQVRSATFYKVK